MVVFVHDERQLYSVLKLLEMSAEAFCIFGAVDWEQNVWSPFILKRPSFPVSFWAPGREAGNPLQDCEKRAKHSAKKENADQGTQEPTPGTRRENARRCIFLQTEKPASNRERHGEQDDQEADSYADLCVNGRNPRLRVFKSALSEFNAPFQLFLRFIHFFAFHALGDTLGVRHLRETMPSIVSATQSFL